MIRSKAKIVLLTMIGFLAVGLAYGTMAGPAELNHAIDINASPELVWKTIEDLEAVRHYNPAIATVNKLTPGATVAGSARECALADGSGKLREQVVAIELGRSITMELIESPWPVSFMRWTTKIQTRPGGTFLTQKMTYSLKFGPAGALLDRLVMRRQMDKTVSEIFIKMKAYLENKQKNE